MMLIVGVVGYGMEYAAHHSMFRVLYALTVQDTLERPSEKARSMHNAIT